MSFTGTTTKLIYFTKIVVHWTVLRIRIRMFLGLLDPDPDPFVRGTDPDIYINKQK
jgi:hypothetical protein